MQAEDECKTVPDHRQCTTTAKSTHTCLCATHSCVLWTPPTAVLSERHDTRPVSCQQTVGWVGRGAAGTGCRNRQHASHDNKQTHLHTTNSCATNNPHFLTGGATHPYKATQTLSGTHPGSTPQPPSAPTTNTPLQRSSSQNQEGGCQPAQ